MHVCAGRDIFPAAARSLWKECFNIFPARKHRSLYLLVSLIYNITSVFGLFLSLYVSLPLSMCMHVFVALEGMYMLSNSLKVYKEQIPTMLTLHIK